VRNKWLIIGIVVLFIAGIGIVVAFQFWQAHRIADAISTANWDCTYIAASKEEPGASDMLSAQSDTEERKEVDYALHYFLVYKNLLLYAERNADVTTPAHRAELRREEAAFSERLSIALRAERNSR